MSKCGSLITALTVALAWSGQFSVAQPITRPSHESSRIPTEPFLLGPPKADGPVVVHVGFHLQDVNAINDEAETFEFTGVFTFTWRDERQSFDPAAAGVDEKVYQGDFQFNEISPSWFPQIILVNEAGMYETHGVVLRSQPDGTQILIQAMNVVAKTEPKMTRFPFDQHRFEAVFEVLGFDNTEVVFEAVPEISSAVGGIHLPQWTLSGTNTEVRNRPAPYAGRRGLTSAFVVSIDAQRNSYFIVRLVMFPLAIIVLLSFSVFWMDRSSLGDRINVSFIGILTGVAYQIVMSGILPRISYVTLINGFLSISFLTMSATVVINLVVGALDRKGKSEVGNRIDRRCRWIFPITYFGLNGLVIGAAFLFY